MSDALYTAQSTAGRIAALERKVAEQTEQLRQKDETISAAYVAPELLAWRAESPHGFSRVYARDAEQARERGAMAQRCAVDAISVERWPEEDLCKAGRKDEQIAELADVLARHGGRNPLVDSIDAAWHTEECWRSGRSSCTSLCRDTVAALAKAGRKP